MKRLIIRGIITLAIIGGIFAANHSGAGYDLSARSPAAAANSQMVQSGYAQWQPCPAGYIVAPDPAYCVSR